MTEREAVLKERAACAEVAKYHAREELRKAEVLEQAGYERLASPHYSAATMAEVIAAAITASGEFMDELAGTEGETHEP